MDDDDLGPTKLIRTKSWKEYEGRDEIPMILSEGLLPIKFQNEEFSDLDYEGALRFYFVYGDKGELMKAVRLTNRTSVRDLIPTLVEKFSLDDNEYELYEHYENDEEILLNLDECPLARAISTKKVPRFVLKYKIDESQVNGKESEQTDQSKKEKKKRLFSIGGKDRKDTENKKIKSEDSKPEKIKKPKKSKKKDKKSSVDINQNVDVSHSEDEILSDEAGENELLNGNQPDIQVNGVDHNIEETDQVAHIHPERPASPPVSDTIEPEIITAEVADQEFSLPETFSEIPEEDDDDYQDYDRADLVRVEVEVEPPVAETSQGETARSDTEEEVTEITFTKHLDEVVESPLTEEVQSRRLSFSNSSIFFEQDNDPPKLDFDKKSKKAKKGKKEKSDKKEDKNKVSSEKTRSKSFSNMLKGQKKKSSEKDGQVELSTNRLTPGILKVFGDHVSKGSNYKAVRVSTISTAQEVVRTALEKYGFENANAKDYVLCDVVGQFTLPDGKATPEKSKKHQKNKKGEKAALEEDQPQWTTEYVRAVHENEKPLVLQSLWKPTNGRSRRFELRRRIDVESSCFFINTADTSGRRNSDASSYDGSDHSSVVGGNEKQPSAENKEFTPMTMSPHSKSNRITGRDNDDSNIAPQYLPYLMLVQGYKRNKDKIVHKLEDPTIIVGPFMEGEQKQCNVALYASDILLPHCWIYKKVKLEEDSTETNLDEINFLVFIEPANGADITINGTPITTTTLIKSGQLIGFGKFYLFIFYDPTQQSPEGPLPWVERLKQPIGSVSQPSPVTAPAPINLHVEKPNVITVDRSVQVESLEQVLSDHTEESDVGSDESDDETQTTNDKYQAQRKQVQKGHLQLTYDINDEEELLHTIIDIADEELGAFKLTPAYFFMMAVEHSGASFTEIQTRKLLLKISSGLQGIAWEKTKEIGKQSSIKESDPLNILNRVLPELKPVLFWMASSLEMLHFLQCNIGNYLLTKEKVTTNKEALLNADEELLTVLEEVIMFTFQQTVYHLTKVLYAALPSIIDVNPFQSEEAAEDEDPVRERATTIHQSIAKITTIFNSVLEAAKEYQVHPQIISQLFAYLFFFSNASLFNSLMERGPGGKFYRWTKGVQIRGNLDVFEEWAQSNGLGSQFEQYMARFINAVDLLALPKDKILQTDDDINISKYVTFHRKKLDWQQMRADYPVLSPAQLQQLLAEYQLGGKPRPRAWYPPPDEVEPALRSSEILESFATHPPLMLPSSNFTMNLNKAPESEEFFKYLELVNQKFGGHNKENGNKIVDEEVAAVEIESVVESVPDNDIDTPTTKKSSKKRTKSNIDMEYVKSAIEYTKNHQEENSPPPSEGNEPVGSIKSIQFQPKKTTITVTSRKVVTVEDRGPTPTDDQFINANGVQQNGVEDLIKQAHVLINSDDITSDDDDDDDNDVDKNLSGNLNGDDDVFVVELQRSERGLGLGLIDGMFTSLKNNGIYVRTIVPNTPASKDPRLYIGDQILAVNGTSLVGSDYSHAMDLIKKAGNKLSFLIAKSDEETRNSILTAST